MTHATSKFAVLIALTAAIPAVAADPAADYPSRPIRVMGQGVGGTADFISRFLGQKLNERWGQPIVVDNRAGAGGTISADIAARAAPDGYTLLMGHPGPMVSAALLYKNLPYDPVRDFAPITLVSTDVMVLTVHPSLPVTSAQELIAYARQKGNLSYASAGNGSMSHLTGELFNHVTGLKLRHIPYKGAGFALTALLSAETQVSFLSPVTAYAQLKAGKVRALAVSSPNRSPTVPDVPSATEAGIPGMDATVWFGLFAPAKTPKQIVTKLNQAVGEILRRPDIREAISKQGANVATSTPEQLGARVASEIARWRTIIKSAGIIAD